MRAVKISCKSEVEDSELLENCEEMFIRYW